MSQKFKLRFDQMRESNPSLSDQSETDKEHECYPSAGNTRNVCFVLENGNSIFLNYAYLVSVEHRNDDGVLLLCFTTHKITIGGSKLEELFKLLMEYRPKYLKCSNPRYSKIEENMGFLITVILIEQSS